MTPDYSEPDGLQWGHFTNSKGADIRYAHVAPKGESKGTVVILSGFRECAEKYFEVVRDMQSRGFDVWMMDWRGQGGSERYLKSNPQKAHHEGYGEQIETLHQFTSTILPKTDKPLLMLAHSMGGHIGLRYLKEHDGVFNGAMLTAPMLDVVTNGMPKPLARQIAKFAKAGNYLDKYVPGGCDWKEGKTPFEKNDKTSDPERFRAETDILKKNPSLQIGDATYGWAYHTFQSIDILNKEDYLKAIKTPILMQTSGEDRVVSKDAQKRAAKILPDCKQINIPQARHEIWQERNALRDQWLKEVDAFLAARFNPTGPAPKKSKPHSVLRRAGHRKPPGLSAA